MLSLIPCAPALTVAVMLALSGTAQAGTLSRSDVAQRFAAPLVVGERDATLPLWPIFKQDLTSTVLVGYAFESIDFAPLPGFSGTPVNLLVAVDAKGGLLDVQVLSHHEPVFLDGLGDAPMHRFVAQYRGLSLMQNIRIGSAAAQRAPAGSAHVVIDGVARATASVRIINQSLLSAALQVARARLGFAAGRDPGLIGRVKPVEFQRMDLAALERAGLVVRKTLLNRDVEAAFAGSAVAGHDAQALGQPQAVFTELLAALIDVPGAGRNLLNDRDWRHLAGWLEPGEHALLVATRGRYGFVGDDYITGAVPERLSLAQDGLPIEIRDFALDGPLALPPDWQGPQAQWRVFKVIRQASLDPARPLDLALGVTRSRGQVLPERVRRDFVWRLQLPAAFVEAAPADDKTWRAVWSARAGEIGVLLAALLLLSVLLARPRWISASPQRLLQVRTAWLVFTLVFIGWVAQGQLSIVNLTALIQALLAQRSLDFFLHDPMTVLLWGFVALSLPLWGRGTFCGWLCPFGALQELVARLARFARLPQWRAHTRTDARLKRIKFALLGLLVALPFVSAAWTDRALEIEPFKTAITLLFDRAWPFVLWAVGLLALGAFVYKGYCRYLCPLGAGLALLGRVRLLRWLPRRTECGQPCQTCRHRCDYQAIARSGAIDYDECFQCLDCVVIFHSDQLCAPRITLQRKRRVIPLQPLSPTAAAPAKP